jgi:poly-gamma-glutamate synthesis protein (capsule biosynthesis protein)
MNEPEPFLEEVKGYLAEMEAAGAEATIMFIHWGTEYQLKQNSQQSTIAQGLCDLGIDVIIGGHPHVVQPIEWLQGENGNKTLCIYSLGNLISAMNNGYNMLGGLMTFDIVKNSKGEIYIDSPLFIPTAFYYADSWFQTELFLLENYDQKKSLTHGSRKHGKNCTRTEMEKLLTQTIDREFLPQWLFEGQ